MFVGITTAPRPDGACYLGGTIRSLFDAGFTGGLHVRAEPGSDVSGVCHAVGPLVLSMNPAKKGNHHNFMTLGLDLVQFSRAFNQKYVITCEDDVVFSPNCKDKIEQALDDLTARDDKFGFLGLYTSSIYQRAIPEGIHYYKAKSLWGACALAWTVDSLNAVITHKDFTGWRGLDSNPPPAGHPDICHVDTCIGNVLIKLGLRTYFCKPAWCQHCGVVSSVRKVKLTPERQASHVFGEADGGRLE